MTRLHVDFLYLIYHRGQLKVRRYCFY